MIQKNFKLEVKSVEEDGSFSGYASVTGNIDSDNEVIDKGAFKRTLDHSKGVVPILWQHDRTQPVGWNVEASEDAFGLAVKGKLMVDTEAGRYAQSFLKTGLEVGAKPGLSIGFTVPKGTDYIKAGIRHFKEVALKEYSIVTFQANELAVATTAKDDSKTKRVAGEDLTAECFAYVGDPGKTETWKLPIKFATDAKTVSHIRNALARFGQTQGIPDSERAGVLAKIHRAAKEHGIDVGDKAQKDFNDSLAEAQTMSTLYQDRCTIERALCDATQDALEDDTMSADDKKADIANSLSQYADAMTDWYGRFIDADTDNDPEEDLEEMDGKQQSAGRAISAASAEQIKAAMGYIMEASASHQKAIGVLKPLGEQAYTANDVNAETPVGEGAKPKPNTNQPYPVGGGKSEQELSDSEDLHSLLELARSVAEKTKAA